jgi:hypothetical protein
VIVELGIAVLDRRYDEAGVSSNSNPRFAILWQSIWTGRSRPVYFPAAVEGEVSGDIDGT